MISAVSRRLKNSQGHTLVELLLVMLLMGVIAGAVLSLYYGLTRSFADTGNRILSQDDARSAMNQMSRYLRMGTFSASNMTTVNDAIAVASPQEVVFYADIDGDGVAEKVRYYLDDQTLKMATAEPDLSAHPPTYPTYVTDSVVVMNGIRNGSLPIFTYYRMNPAYDPENPDPAKDFLVKMTNPSTTVELANILAIGLTLHINERPDLSRGNVELETIAQIRQRYNGGLGEGGLGGG